MTLFLKHATVLLAVGLLLMGAQAQASQAPIAMPSAPQRPDVAAVAGPKTPTMPQTLTGKSGPGVTGTGADVEKNALTGLANKITTALSAPEKPLPESTAPVFGSADSNGGYGARVLEKILPYWQPPAGVSGVVTVALRIGSDGRPLYCETTRRSGNQLLDELPCQAAVRAGSFGNPPYGLVTEVYLTLATDRAALGTQGKTATQPSPTRSYAEEIMYRVKPLVQVPPGLDKAPHTVELLLRVSPSGSVEELSVARSSGRQDVDNAVMTALLKPGVMPALPADSPPLELRLLFTVTGN